MYVNFYRLQYQSIQSMKTNFLLVFASAFLLTFQAFSQSKGPSIQVGGNIMYTFQESFPVYAGTMRLQDGATYGASLAGIFGERVELKFTYQNQPVMIDLQRYPYQLGDYDNEANIQYFILGCNRLHLLSNNEKIIPYTGAGLAVATLSFKDTKYETLTRAAFTLNIGSKFMINDRLGLNAYAMIQSPISGFGVSVGAGTGGATAGVSTYSYVVQFGLGGGLIYKLK